MPPPPPPLSGGCTGGACAPTGDGFARVTAGAWAPAAAPLDYPDLPDLAGDITTTAAARLLDTAMRPLIVHRAAAPLTLFGVWALVATLVLPDASDVRTMLAPENAAYIATPDDAVIADRIAALLADPAERDRIGMANRAKAKREFDQSAIFASWHALWTGAA